jgi:hypothetical protein
MDAPLGPLMVTNCPEGTAPLTGEITGAASCVSEGGVVAVPPPPQPTIRSMKMRQAMEQILMNTFPLIWDRRVIIGRRRQQQIVIYAISLLFLNRRFWTVVANEERRISDSARLALAIPSKAIWSLLKSHR